MARPSTGLRKVSVPVYVGGALDTKTNPKLVQPGSLLELENMYQLKTGELRLRNGFAALATSSQKALTSCDNLFVTPQGNLETITRGWTGVGGGDPFPTPVKYNSTGSAGWERAALASTVAPGSLPSPVFRASVSGIEASGLGASTVAADLADPDIATAGGYSLCTWNENGLASGGGRYLIKDAAGGRIHEANLFSTGNNARPPVACNGGSAFLVSFYVDTAGTPSLKALTTQAATFSMLGTYTVALNDVSAAQPWFDCKPIPGGNLIAVAYRATGGGVTCLIFNPSTGAVTNIVNTAAADATMTLGWLDDSLATGNMYLATAGGTAGVVVRTMSAATMVVSATNVIDATATANIRNITGHINTSATNYVVLWDVSNATTYFDAIKVGRWTGAAAVAFLAPSFSLYSRTLKMADGKYYVVGAYDSTVQPTYSLLGTDDYNPNAAHSATSQCQIATGEGGGRRTVQCSLASGFTSGSSVVTVFARKVKLITPGAAAPQGRIVQQLSLASSIAAFARPRELGGTLFIPGGLIQRDDGKVTGWATCPFYPESPTLVSSATGAMTASGTYSYRDVFRRTSADGRVTRSAGSVPTSVTLGAGDGRVTVTSQNPRLQPATNENYVIEHYRAGPAAAGATGYNKVGESYADATLAANTIAFVDSMSDVNAALGETAYFTGNVLENFPPPSHNLLEVNGNRVGVVNAEDTTEFWPSKEYKPRVGIGFHPDLAIRVTGDGFGGMTALAAMDGRWILFKSSAIYVISGDGPNDLGQGSFNAPQAVSLSIGTVLPGSVVSTPEGLMFQSSKGIYLLDRGLGLTFIGKEAEQYTLAANVVDASLVTGTTTVRFVMASGRMLEWDYHHKRWYTHQLRVGASTVVACANPSTGWCYALADGTVLQETPGVYSDVMGSSTAIVPRISFPHLNLAGLNGYQRVYGLDITGDVVGNHTISVDCEFDYSGAVTGTPRTKAQTGTAGFQLEYNPPEGKAKSSSIRPVITTSVLAAGSGAFKLTGLNVWVGVKRGSNVPSGNRLT